MTMRHAIAAFLFLAAAFGGPIALAVDEELIISPRSGAETAASQPAALNNLYEGGASSVGMVVTIFGYVVILGGLAVVVWYLFKRGVIRQPFSKGEGRLKIAESRMLGNRQFLMVVEYDDQKILLGVGPGKIDYLTNLQSHSGDFGQLDALNRRAQGGEG